MISREELLEEARALGVTVSDIIVLANQNDPFYTGTPTQIEHAEWFAAMWDKGGYTGRKGIHLRRVHYKIATMEEDIKLPSVLRWKKEDVWHETDVYVNEKSCWKFMLNAGRFARYLGLVPLDAFIDKRNPDPVIYTEWDESAGPSSEITGEWNSYDYHLELPELVGLPYSLPELPRLSAGGYDEIQQGYHVEIWCEKSGMNEELIPICREYGVNLIIGLGHMSITSVCNFMERVRSANRPGRILYISDYDKKGREMPVAVARKIEWLQHKGFYGDLDIIVEPIVLTLDQVNEYSLPHKYTTKEKDWIVELDALAALREGEFERIVEDSVKRYYDPDLRKKAWEVDKDLQFELDRIGRDILRGPSDDMTDLDKEYKELLEDYNKTREEFGEFVSGFSPQLEEYKERLNDIVERAESVYTMAYTDLEGVEVPLNEYPFPDPEVEGEVENPLYDWRRDYWDQLKAYKNNKEVE